MASGGYSDISEKLQAMQIDSSTMKLISRRSRKIGYQNDFVDPVRPDDYCAICLLVVRDPLQVLTCGHSFCKACFSQWIKSCNRNNGELRCPGDNCVITKSDVHPDLKQKRSIQGLRVYCENRMQGCQVTPELRNLELHMKDCMYRLIECELGCGVCITAWSLDTHVKTECLNRIASCPICLRKMEVGELKIHENICPQKLVNCDYCLAPTMTYLEMTNHLQYDCPEYQTFCTYAFLGCSNKIKRRDLESHHRENAVKHAGLVARGLLQMYDTMGEVWPLCGAADVSSATLSSLCELPVVFRGFVNRNDINWSVLPGNVYDDNDDVTQPSVAMNVKKALDKIDEIKEDLDEVSDRAEENENSIVSIKENAEEIKESIADSNLELFKQIAHINHGLTCKVKSGSSGYRYICPFSWRLHLVKGMDDIYSPYFYSAYEGYKMYILVTKDSDGDWRIKYYLSKGENDENLTWPYPGNHKLTVIEVDTGDAKITANSPSTDARKKPTRVLSDSALYSPYFKPKTDYMLVDIKIEKM